MRHGILFLLGTVALALEIAAQSVDVVRPEDQQKARRAVVKKQEKRAKQTSIIEFRGEQAFKENELRVALKEEITTIEDFGLSPARADDLAFFLEVFYRKHGYAKVDVHYVIESGARLRLNVDEGPRFLLSQVIFDGNAHEPADKLFEYIVGPTRERYSRMEKTLPFVASDLEEGTHLVQRFYVAEGFLNAVVDPPRDKFLGDSSDVEVVVPIHEGRQYLFGNVTFSGRTVYGAEALRGQGASDQTGPRRWTFVAARHLGRGGEKQGIWFLGLVRCLRRCTRRCASRRQRSVSLRPSAHRNHRGLSTQLSR